MLEFIARLVSPASDPGGPQPALGLRGEGAVTDHRLYRAGPYHLDVASLGRGILVGQILPAERDAPSLAGSECVLWGGPTPLTTRLGDHGDFRLERVQPGDYSLVIEGARTLVALPELTVQPGGWGPEAP